MSEQPNLEFLSDFAKAMKFAEKAEAQTRHGSTLAEYEAARRLGEVIAALENDPVMDGKIGGVTRPSTVKAVRDLPDNAGVMLIMEWRGKDHRLDVTFDELREIGNVRQDNEALVDKWRKALKSSTTLVDAPKTARPTAKKLPDAATKRKSQNKPLAQ